MSGASKPPVDREAIRALVRQVLRDALPDTVREKIAADAAKIARSMSPRPALASGKAAAKSKPSGENKPETATSKVEVVSISSDGELAAFVRRLLALTQDKKQREAIQAGRLRFQLRQAPRETPSTAGGGAAERIDKGLVTERKLVAVARAGKKLVVAKGVVLTPLARDKARQLGVRIERE